MAVTATAALVSTYAGDAARPGYSAPNQGWNNRVGDPSWIPDIDWYRRVKLEAVAGAGEDVRTVNWECYGPTIPFKTQAEIDATTAGAVASPLGTVLNNSTTWTVWVTTGVATAGQPKYKDTKTPPVSELRANGQRVQVILGKKKMAIGTTETYTVAAFLPLAGKMPTATATVIVQAPLGVQLQVTMDEDTPGRVVFDIPNAPGATVWSFGDGTEDTQGDAHTVHHYTESGIYEVRAVGDGGVASYAMVEVSIPEEPEAELEEEPEEEPVVKKDEGRKKGKSRA